MSFSTMLGHYALKQQRRMNFVNQASTRMARMQTLRSYLDFLSVGADTLCHTLFSMVRSMKAAQ